MNARLIPARAGKTCTVSSSGTVFAAHPRAGGENFAPGTGGNGQTGSSPRGRGKPSATHSTPSALRLIPARAGKTRAVAPSSPSPGAHPRAGGENSGSRRGFARLLGSSPRGRGKLAVVLAAAHGCGLIPARAGKTAVEVLPVVDLRAHPRAGGENFVECRPGFCRSGSSPRGRGKQPPLRNSLTSPGLIPARAGKTVPDWEHKALPGAHPRAGGENSSTLSTSPPGFGSSPRGRGKLYQMAVAQAAMRLIPARAGKTPTSLSGLRATAAHPRAGGENSWRMVCLLGCGGSSPRGRGKRRGPSTGRRVSRLIPARAGKTRP